MTRAATQRRRGQGSIEASVVVAAVCVLMAAAVWAWRATVFRAQRMEVRGESWERLKEDYPIPEEGGARAQLSVDVFDGTIKANPFSSERRLKPPPPDTGATGEGGAVLSPPVPKFVYKGQIKLGARQRAIVEDLTAKKTFFLEVGQEVAGCKVLDIAENRVLLSDLKTNEQIVVSLTSTTSP